MGSASIKIEQTQIKKEQDCGYHNEEQPHEAMGLVKSEFNYLTKTKCKENCGMKCECASRACNADYIDPNYTDYICDNNKVKLEENDHKNLVLNDNAGSISDSYLGPPDCYDDDDEQKIDISAVTLGFGQEYQGSEMKVEKQCETDLDALLDSQTGQMVQLKQLEIPLVDHKYSLQFPNSNKHFNENGDLTLNLTMTVGDGHSETANCECKQIHSSTNRKTSLKTPCKIHANRKSHVCPSCQKSFAAKRTLFSHILISHSDDQNLLNAISCNIYSCPKCPKQSINKSFIDGHIRRDHNDYKDLTKIFSGKNFMCPKCSEHFVYKFTFESHIISNHSDDEDLLKIVSSKKLLKMVSSEKHACSKCDEEFNNKFELDSHLINVHQDDKIILGKIFDCPKCKEQFACKSNLDYHVVSKHNHDQNLLKTISRNIYNCPKCSRQFIYKSKFDRHIVSSHKTEPLNVASPKIYECPSCGKQFVRKYILDNHVLKLHNNDQNLLKMISSKIYSCPKCDKQFTFQSTLQYHIVSKHKHDRNLLNTVSSKKHTCPKCKKQFAAKYYLDRHMRSVHKDDENVSQIISGKVIYNCPKCKKQFSGGKRNFDGHIVTRHGHDANLLKLVTSKTHSCPKCDKHFINRFCLDAHLLSIHKNEK